MTVKTERLKRDWTQIDLSYHSRVPAAEISKIETGRLKPTFRQLEKIAKALGVCTEQINASNGE